MTVKTTEPGDVLIKSLSIKNKTLNAEINPLDQLIGVDIYEDMTKPTMYASFVFTDSIGMLSNFPIIGEEIISIEIQTPGISSSTTFTFRSFEVTGVQKDGNGKSVTYAVRCVSEEHLKNGSNLIKQSYTDLISNMVPSILVKYLSSSKPLILDETKGIQTLAIPKLNPLQTIDMLRQRAVSSRYPSSSFVFFENQAGFNFKTIEGLIKEGKPNIGSREFNAQQNVMGDKTTQAKAFRTILDYKAVARADSNKKAAMGVFKAVTKSFDLNTKEFGSAGFDLKDVFGKFQKPGDGKQIPNSDDFIKDFGSGVPRQFFVPKDTTRPDNFIDTMIASRNSFAALLNTDVTRVMIHGDTGLKVGDLVSLILPTPSGTTDRKKDDQLSSGNYLIVRLRHIVTPGTKAKHKIVFDCVKMGI
jgi:hypothetical protein